MLKKLNRPPRCAIVGGGVVGLAAAAALAETGAPVALFDRFGPLHRHGSSHGATRLFRLAYFEHPDYVPLLQRALGQWREMTTRNGSAVFHETGVIEAGPADGELVAGVRRASETHGLTTKALSQTEARARFPWLELPDRTEVLIEPEAGFINSDAALQAFIDRAGAAGAEFHWGEPATELEVSDGGLALHTDVGQYAVDRLILAPGAFAADVFRLLDCDLPQPIVPVEKILCWQAPGVGGWGVGDGTRPFAVEKDNGEIFYGFPAIDAFGVKVGRHSGGDRLANAAVRAYANPEETAAIAGFLETHIPGLAGRDGKRAACLYAMSPDGDFIVDRLASDNRIAYAVGLSGHGFKFAPVLGEALAAMCLDQPFTPTTEFLSAARFKG